MKENNVQIEAWGPFAEGKNNLFYNETLESIGEKYNKAVAQVVLRWLIQRGVVAIPKCVRKERMEENFNIFDFELDGKEMDKIETLNHTDRLLFSHLTHEIVKAIDTLNRAH